MNKEIEIAYAAGILEGEGSFLIKTGSNLPRVSCQMTDKDVLDRIKNIFNEGNIYKVAKRQKHWKQAYVWLTTESNSSIRVMKKVIPYMSLRRTIEIKKCVSIYENHINNKKLKKNKFIEAGKYYDEHSLSLREVANKFNVSYESVRRYSS